MYDAPLSTGVKKVSISSERTIHTCHQGHGGASTHVVVARAVQTGLWRRSNHKARADLLDEHDAVEDKLQAEIKELTKTLRKAKLSHLKVITNLNTSNKKLNIQVEDLADQI